MLLNQVTVGSAVYREFSPTSYVYFSSVRADDIMNGYFGSLTYTHVVALPAELLSQVIKYSSVGSAVAFLSQITLFEGRRLS